MPNTVITSFNNGEVSPYLDARADLAKYANSCRTLENMIPLVYGAVTSRPGTKWVANAKSNATAVRLIPFVYSATVAYMLEFGEHYIRAYYGATLIDEIVTTYDAADLPAIHYHQIGDTLWLVHPNYAPAKVTRTDATTFALNTIAFEHGPFLTRNDLDEDSTLPNVTLTCSVTNKGQTGTLTASAPLFVAGHVGATFRLTQSRANNMVQMDVLSPSAVERTTTAIPVKGTFNFDTHTVTRWTGTVILERSEDAGATWDSFRTYYAKMDKDISLAAVENDDDILYRVRIPALGLTGGRVIAEITVDSAIQEGIVRVDSVTSPLVAAITVLSSLANATATERWAEGAWSTYRGFPGAIAFFEDRIVYAGTDHDPQTVWFSAVDDFEDFQEDVKDADSFSIMLASTNRIRWLQPLDVLSVGTSGDEWRIGSTRLSEAVTPTNFNAKQQTTYGGSTVQPVKVNHAALFLDYSGRKIREFTLNPDADNYVAPDLTQLAEHISLGGITAMALQKSPDCILWCVANGGLCSLTYERDQSVVAWARHPMTGCTVESVAVIPGTTEDVVWLATVRGGVRMLEMMGPRAFGTQADAYSVDCGVAYTGAATTFIGLDHLEGQTVSILGDGAVFPTQVVSGGSVTIDTSVVKCAIGLPFTYTAKPMRIQVNTQAGASHAAYMKIAELAVSFYKTLNAKYGPDATHLLEIEWRSTEDYDAPPALFTGDKPLTLDGGFDPETPILISGSDPLPCCVRAIVAGVEQTGR